MDAMFNHREVIDPIIEGGGFFVIELKANQKDLSTTRVIGLRQPTAFHFTARRPPWNMVV